MDGEIERGNQKKIVLVEDDGFLREILFEKLTRVGYDVIALEGGTSVLETTAQKMPDIVLLDILMPQKNGFEIIEELKKDERTKSIPVIVLSNLGQSEDIAKAKELGADEFLTKANFMPEEIIERIEEILS